MRKKIFKIFVTALLLVSIINSCPSAMVFADQQLMITNLSAFFVFPSEVRDNWTSRQIKTLPDKGVSAFIFGRTAIIDGAGEKISPSVSFIFEPVSNQQIAAEYAMAKATSIKSSINATIDKVYEPDDKLFPWSRAIGYKLHYNEKNGKEHTVYMVNGLFAHNDRTYGVQVIMDTTTSVLPAVESEFTAMLTNLSVGQ